ncbi:trypsin-like peptidase domain-containing protein [Nonomuraea sp. MTCD27]|uniref:trypsin-like peptidase domain-containing protein n=1 Tax=Nonomuraea sp. MTCD27 TaxID=1676747 RepID=UPI0035C20CAA
MDISAEVRENRVEHTKAAAVRYRWSGSERDEAGRRRERGEAFPDTPEMLATRTARLIQRNGIPVEAALEATRPDVLDRPRMYERILGVAKDLQAWSFLPRGARAARTVARISVCENGREIPIGTGFLVSPRLMLTNHHVFPDVTVARSAIVEFDAQVTVDNAPDVARRFFLDPDALFVADRDLDYALVLVSPGADGRPVGETFGWNRLSVQRGKLVIGEAVNIIGHPSGRLKEISIRENRLEARLDDFLQYQTDTEPGSSGSPVFNDQWEVTALHHSGVPRTDGQGRILRRDGQVWHEGDGDDAVDWVSNEGVRISVILKHLAALPLDGNRRALLAEMGRESGLQDRPLDGLQDHPPDGLQDHHPDGLLTGPRPQPQTGPQAEPQNGLQAEPQDGPQGGVAPRTAAAGLVPPPAPSVDGIPVETGAQASAGPLPAGVPVQAGVPGAGLASRPTAFGGSVHLVFLHGRGQQGHDPERLRRYWTAGLNGGLTRAGLDTITPDDVWFPFYAPRLVQAMGALETLPTFAREALGDPVEAAAPQPGGARRLYEQLITEAAARTGMPEPRPVGEEGLSDAVHQALSWLADTTDLDRLFIAAIFGDVAAYLDDQRVREAVLDCVLQTMPRTGRLALVTHSLGTIVAMDLLTRLPPEVEVDLLVTTGSPLGLDSVHERLLSGGPHRPGLVARWFNVWCPIDPVAIGCPLSDHWEGELTEIPVANPAGRAHDIEEYLAHPEVAQVIGGTLTAPAPA